MIRRRHGFVWVAHFQSSRAKAGEGLRRGDFVNQVQVNVQDSRRVRLLRDDVSVPDFFDEGLRLRHDQFRLETTRSGSSFSFFTRPLLSLGGVPVFFDIKSDTTHPAGMVFGSANGSYQSGMESGLGFDEVVMTNPFFCHPERALCAKGLRSSRRDSSLRSE